MIKKEQKEQKEQTQYEEPKSKKKIKIKHDKNLLTTRFTNETFNENMHYRETHQIECIYSSSLPISDKLPYQDYYVMEMNNSINKIMGIGKISKTLQPVVIMYSYRYYNRYTYKGTQYVPIYDMHDNKSLLSEEKEKIILEVEQLIFYGRGHTKRGSSYTSFPIFPIKHNHYIKLLISIFNEVMLL